LKLISAILFSLLSASCNFFTPVIHSSPVIVLTFDDQHHSIYDIALPLMNQHGFSGTNFVNSGALGLPGLLTWDQLTTMQNDFGWETGGHSLNHEHLPEISFAEAEYAIREDHRLLNLHDLNPKSFALPRGDCPLELYPVLSELYDNLRGSSDFAMHKPLNRYALGCLSVQGSWTAEPVIQRINRGIARGESLIIIGFHRFTVAPTGTDYTCPQAVFADILNHIASNEIPVKTLAQAVEDLAD